jgi:hypothetical protein
VAQGIMVDEIFISEREPEHPLPDECRNRMFDEILPAIVVEASGQPVNEADRFVRGTEQKCAGVGRHRPAIETTHNQTARDRCKVKRIRVTVCGHRGAPSNQIKSLLQNNFLRFKAPMHPNCMRFPG